MYSEPWPTILGLILVKGWSFHYALFGEDLTMVLVKSWSYFSQRLVILTSLWLTFDLDLTNLWPTCESNLGSLRFDQYSRLWLRCVLVTCFQCVDLGAWNQEAYIYILSPFPIRKGVWGRSPRKFSKCILQIVHSRAVNSCLVIILHIISRVIQTKKILNVMSDMGTFI